MPNHLSILGIIHTAISVFALFAAFYALFKSGKINYGTKPGNWYIILTILTCLTSLPIMKTGHFTGAHGLAIIVLVLLPIGIYTKQLRIFGKLTDYVQTLVMSFTLFLSCIPAVVETLTRLPISQPIASGPADPIIQTGLLTLVVLFIAGVIYQFIKIKSNKKSTPDGAIKLG